MEMIIDGEVFVEQITDLTKDFLSRIQWRTKDEGLIFIKDMEDKHLRNTVLFLFDFGYQKCLIREDRRIIWLQIFRMEWTRRVRASEAGNKKYKLYPKSIRERLLQ